MSPLTTLAISLAVTLLCLAFLLIGTEWPWLAIAGALVGLIGIVGSLISIERRKA